MEQTEEKKVRGRPRVSAESHTKVITVNLTGKQKAALVAYSKASGKTLSKLVDEWIREALDENTAL